MQKHVKINVIGILAILSLLCIALWMIGTKTDLNEARINVLESKQQEEWEVVAEPTAQTRDYGDVKFTVGPVYQVNDDGTTTVMPVYRRVQEEDEG